MEQQQYQCKYEYNLPKNNQVNNDNDKEEERMRIAHMAGIARNTVRMEASSSDSACPEFKCEEKKFPSGYRKRNVASLTDNIQPKIAKTGERMKPGPKPGPRPSFIAHPPGGVPIESVTNEERHEQNRLAEIKKMEMQAQFLQNVALGCAVVAGGLFIYNYYFKSGSMSSVVIIPEEIVEVAENVISN